MTALEFHPLSDLFPLLEGVEFDELVADIKAHGCLENIHLYEGKILDGRNRYRACLAAGVNLPCLLSVDATGFDPVAFVISKNIRRRHLNGEQRQHLLVTLIAHAPEKSDRQIAKEIGVDHKTVGRARAKGEDVGRIPHVSKRTDTRGRKQPAKKSPKGADRKQPAPKPVKHDERIISPELGERVGRLAYKLIQLDRELARELADLILQRGVAERLWADLDTGIDLEERAS
jgi:ParB-like chromosome segregation protein Spo0J